MLELEEDCNKLALLAKGLVDFIDQLQTAYRETTEARFEELEEKIEEIRMRHNSEDTYRMEQNEQL
jgi:hypothetical protein